MRHIYLREPLAGNSDFGIGQVYSQEVIKQMHLEIPTPITILTIFITPGQVRCRKLARLTQAKARRYIASNLRTGSLENRSVDNGTALWWEDNGLEVVELMGHDPLFTHFRYKPPNELYVFVQHVYWVPGALSEFVFRGRFYRTTLANIQAHAMYRLYMVTLSCQSLRIGIRILLAIQAQVMQAQESAPAVQAQTSVDTTADNVSDDGASNGEPADAIAEAEFEFDTDNSTVIDEPPLNGDNSDVDISDSEDSEDSPTYPFESDMDSEYCFLNLLENPTNDFVTDDDRIKAVFRAAHRSLFR